MDVTLWCLGLSTVVFVTGFCALWKMPKDTGFVVVPAFGFGGMYLSLMALVTYLSWVTGGFLVILSLYIFWRGIKSYYNFFI